MDGDDDRTADDGDRSPDEDDDRTLDLIGLALVGFILFAVVVGLLAVVVLAPGGDAGPPETDWVLNRVNDTQVQIGHAGGDTVAGEELLVTVDGTERAASFPDEISRGEAEVVRASSGQVVRLYWTGGDDRDLLAEWTVGEARDGTTESGG